MVSLEENIAKNLKIIRLQIELAAERARRNSEDITLIAVTKSVSLEAVQALIRLNQLELAENRVEMARTKIESITAPVKWHMIGTVQRRKASDIVELFDTVDSVDRVEVAESLQKCCEEQQKKISVLLEVNVSGETTKHGFTPEELGKALSSMRSLDCLEIKGLMTMAPYVDDSEEVRPFFASLKQLADQYDLPEISMGMSNDFEIAIEEGATQVRIGTALFE